MLKYANFLKDFFEKTFNILISFEIDNVNKIFFTQFPLPLIPLNSFLKLFIATKKFNRLKMLLALTFYGHIMLREIKI